MADPLTALPPTFADVQRHADATGHQEPAPFVEHVQAWAESTPTPDQTPDALKGWRTFLQKHDDVIVDSEVLRMTWGSMRAIVAQDATLRARLAALETNEQTAAESNAVLGVIRAFARAHGWRDEGEQTSLEEFVRLQMGASDSDIIVGVSSVGDGAQLVDDRLYTTRAVRRILDERIAALETVTDAMVEAALSVQFPEGEWEREVDYSGGYVAQQRKLMRKWLTAALAARTEGR